MKVIFLDIDGVLNASGTRARAPSGCIGLDEDKILRLKHIIDKTHAKVVLTSTWKTEWFKTPIKEDLPADGQYLERRLEGCGIKIFDKTIDSAWARRGQGILDWINKFPNQIESFIMLDDEQFDYASVGIIDRLVKTRYLPLNKDDTDLGLQDWHIEKAVKILNDCKS